MAIREIRKDGDEILMKNCREVTEFDEKLHTLLDDMAQTMEKANGVGLAAPQVGVLKRVCIIDVGEGLIELINPEIIEEKGEQTDVEGCLSFPGKWGEVTRANYVKVRGYNRFGDLYEYEGEGLLARAFCHEIDHLSGHVFLEKVSKFVEVE